VRARSRAASRSDRPLTLAHRSITSPFLAHLASKHWKRPLSRWTLKVRPRASPRWIGQAQRCCGPWPRRRETQAELIQDASDRQLPCEVGEVEEGVLVHGWLWYTLGTGRGDLFPNRLN